MVKPEDFDATPLNRRIGLAVWAPEPVHIASKRNSDLAITQAFVQATFEATVSQVVHSIHCACGDPP